MFLPTLFVCLSVSIYGVVSQDFPSDSDFYQWKPFTTNGNIPEDAIPVHNLRHRPPTFIASLTLTFASGDGDSFVREINKDGSIDYTDRFDRPYTVKILCAPDHGNFYWRLAHGHTIRFLTNAHLVVGGRDDMLPLVVARSIKFLPFRYIVGGAPFFDLDRRGLKYTIKGNSSERLQGHSEHNYEVLMYRKRNCN